MFPYVPHVYAQIAWSLFVTLLDPGAWVPQVQPPVAKEKSGEEE